MSDLLAQIIVARSEDGESWMNVLVVVVLAAFWIIGGIVKARTKKPEGQDEEQLPRTPVRRPPARSMGPREQLLSRPHRPPGPAQRPQHRPGTQQARATFADLRAAARKFAAEAEQAFQVPTAEPTPAPKQAVPRPQVQPDIQELPEFAKKPVKGLDDKRLARPARLAPAEYLSELGLDFADPDELRRAILHYEILGKPLSLRDPSASVIGL
ncbi:MAG: hypothetical protein ACYSYV_07755 [Planctomycetota bacterium]|jgi:hypothetical protein